MIAGVATRRACRSPPTDRFDSHHLRGRRRGRLRRRAGGIDIGVASIIGVTALPRDGDGCLGERAPSRSTPSRSRTCSRTPSRSAAASSASPAPSRSGRSEQRRRRRTRATATVRSAASGLERQLQHRRCRHLPGPRHALHREAGQQGRAARQLARRLGRGRQVRPDELRQRKELAGRCRYRRGRRGIEWVEVDPR